MTARDEKGRFTGTPHARHYSVLLGWTDAETYDELYDKLCFRYHPAVAAVLAHDILIARDASQRGHETRQQRSAA